MGLPLYSGPRARPRHVSAVDSHSGTRIANLRIHAAAAKMKWSSASLALALVAPSQAYLRFGCATLTVERLDPIVEPGRVGSAHLHQVSQCGAFSLARKL